MRRARLTVLFWRKRGSERLCRRRVPTVRLSFLVHAEAGHLYLDCNYGASAQVSRWLSNSEHDDGGSHGWPSLPRECARVRNPRVRNLRSGTPGKRPFRGDYDVAVCGAARRLTGGTQDHEGCGRGPGTTNYSDVGPTYGTPPRSKRLSRHGRQPVAPCLREWRWKAIWIGSLPFGQHRPATCRDDVRGDVGHRAHRGAPKPIRSRACNC